MKLVITDQKPHLSFIDSVEVFESFVMSGSFWQLPKGALSIDAYDNFRADFTFKPTKEASFKKLIEIAKGATSIYLLFSNTSKGHFLANYLKVELSVYQNEIYFHAIDDQTNENLILDSSFNQSINMNKVSAHKVRKIITRVIEYKMAPFVWFKGHPDCLLTLAQLQGVYALERLEIKKPFNKLKDLEKFYKKQGLRVPKLEVAIKNLIIEEFVIDDGNEQFALTDQGHDVASAIDLLFPSTLFSRLMERIESLIESLENGMIEEVKILQDFWSLLQIAVEKANIEVERIKSQESRTEHQCQLCHEANYIVKWGKHGEFLACENFPKCSGRERFIREKGEIKIIPKEYSHLPCTKCNSRMEIVLGRFGRYTMCENYPKCRTTSVLKLEIHCPECVDGYYVEKKSRFGKVFYGCSQYPTCQHSLWALPVQSECENCHFPIMAIREGQKLGRHLECPKCHSKKEFKEEILI